MIELTKLACLTAAVVLGWSGPGLADDLAKASQNPVGDLISVPFELSYYGACRATRPSHPSWGLNRFGASDVEVFSKGAEKGDGAHYPG